MEPEASAELNIDELTYGQLLTHLANLGFEGEFEEVDEMKRELRRFKEEETAPFNPQEVLLIPFASLLLPLVKLSFLSG